MTQMTKIAKGPTCHSDRRIVGPVRWCHCLLCGLEWCERNDPEAKKQRCACQFDPEDYPGQYGRDLQKILEQEHGQSGQSAHTTSPGEAG